MVAELIKLVFTTIRNPRHIAGKIVEMELPDRILWPGVVLVVIVSVLLSELANWLLSFGSVRPGLILFNSPCLLYTSPSPRDGLLSRMPSSA